MEGHTNKCVERYFESGKNPELLYAVSTSYLNNHNFKKEDLKIRKVREKEISVRTSFIFDPGDEEK